MAVKQKKAGSRSSSVNKSELIREILVSASGEVRNKDVIATLKDRKIVVSPAQVSNVRTALAKKDGRKSGRGRAGRGRSGAAAHDSVSLASLVAAKKLAEAMGGLERARVALDALAKLR